MEKKNNYSDSRREIIRKGSRMSRLKRQNIQRSDREKSERYGESFAKFLEKKNQVIENTHPEELDGSRNIHGNHSSFSTGYLKTASALLALKGKLEALVEVAERNENRLPDNVQVKFLLEGIKKYLAETEAYEKQNIDSGHLYPPYHGKPRA